MRRKTPSFPRLIDDFEKAGTEASKSEIIFPPLMPTPQFNDTDPADLVMLPMADSFMEWQEAPELAEVINAWFDLPPSVVDDILAMIRAIRQ